MSSACRAAVTFQLGSTTRQVADFDDKIATNCITRGRTEQTCERELERDRAKMAFRKNRKVTPASNRIEARMKRGFLLQHYRSTNRQ